MPGEFSCCPQDFQRVYKVCRLSGNDADSDEEDNDYGEDEDEDDCCCHDAQLLKISQFPRNLEEQAALQLTEKSNQNLKKI